MVDFIHLFAPHYPVRLIRDAAALETQEQVDELLKELELPLRGAAGEAIAVQ